MPELTSTGALTAAEEIKEEHPVYAAMWNFAIDALTGEKDASGKKIKKPQELPYRISSLQRLKRVTAWALRFIKTHERR